MKYSYVLHTKEKSFLIEECADIFAQTGKRNLSLAPYEIQIECADKGIYKIVEMTVSCEEESAVCLSLCGKGEGAWQR